MRNHLHFPSWKPVLSALLFSLASGCSFVRLQRDLDRFATAVRIEGTVAVRDGSHSPVEVVLVSHGADKTLIRNIWFAESSQGFTFVAEPGRYSIFAFEDVNKNSDFDSGEPAAEFGGGEPMELEAGATRTVGRLVLTAGAAPSVRALEALAASKSGVSLVNKNLSFGSVAALSDPQFSRENASLGFWQPITFLTRVPSGLFMLQPYDPERIPVVFVHGANGTPADFTEAIASMDRTKFQPWVFSYPSGLSLPLCSLLLGQSLNRTAAAHAVSDVFVVAHSMGGLVSRRFILDELRDGSGRHTRLFVSVASPFGGHEAATSGVEHAPAVIPSWREMQPHSEFLKELFEQSLRPKVPYYLLFGYRGGGVSFRENNDGVVTLKSMLRPEAQREARRISGFDAGHVEILKDAGALAELNMILSQEDASLRSAEMNARQ